MFGENEENRVSTPHVLSMRPYPKIRTKHAIKGHLVKTRHFTLLKVSCRIKKVIPINQTCLQTQSSNMYPKILQPMIY